MVPGPASGRGSHNQILTLGRAFLIVGFLLSEGEKSHLTEGKFAQASPSPAPAAAAAGGKRALLPQQNGRLSPRPSFLLLCLAVVWPPSP